MTPGRVLVVDDKENMLKLFERLLEGPDFNVTTTSDPNRALAIMEAQEFDVVVTDLRMPGVDGFEILRAARTKHPETEVVMMTAFATVADAVEAMKRGAYDYLQKPFDPEVAELTIARALERKRLKQQASSLLKQLQEAHSFHNIIGRSQAMQRVYRSLEQAAGLDITVLMGGETGTGKELAAKAIHFQSRRRDRPFVPVNCGALPAELVESELFGHARGAFTGAATARRGLFEEADGGTLFLDEVGELPQLAQVKLNRVLQESEVRRVGDNAVTRVDVRVIAATHRDLKQEVQAGRFREDLFYRLHIFPVRMPPLRERSEDIPLLAAHFLQKYTKRFGRTLSGFSPDALRLLATQAWPGNVRELENVVERAVAVAGAQVVELEDLPAEIHDDIVGASRDDLHNLPYRNALELSRDRFSREYLSALMKRFEGNVTRASEPAGVERESLHRLLKRFAIRPDDFRPER